MIRRQSRTARRGNSTLLSTDHELIPVGCKRPVGGVQSMQVDGRLPVGQRYRDVVIYSLTANIGYSRRKITASFTDR
jgi:hypothetical protein